MQSDCALDEFHRASRIYPSLLHDVNKHGEPISFSPPTWRCWQVEELRFYERDRNLGRRWECAGTYWIASLTELQTLHDRLPSTAGLYLYRRLTVSSWLWSYDDPQWQEEDHV